ncbi:hypothetical protein EVAR_4400_1 [Eumeta japonica]|uniref:Uncharacterized protein n=1 Tax=Eumeta variegata TaxID=151549 RepID=A0A4C1SXN3_EUMVA|nr:hypothetical protein EVAR_4400_1 [Eumeta japonica]
MAEDKLRGITDAALAPACNKFARFCMTLTHRFRCGARSKKRETKTDIGSETRRELKQKPELLTCGNEKNMGTRKTNLSKNPIARTTAAISPAAVLLHLITEPPARSAKLVRENRRKLTHPIAPSYTAPRAIAPRPALYYTTSFGRTSWNRRRLAFRSGSADRFRKWYSAADFPDVCLFFASPPAPAGRPAARPAPAPMTRDTRRRRVASPSSR